MSAGRPFIARKLDALDRDADAFLANSSSGDAMRQWMDHYAGLVIAKHAMHDALRIALAPRSIEGSETTIGYVHIDICELRHADGKIHMFLAIDRVSKFTFVEFYDKAGKMNAATFMRHAIEAFPYKIHTVLTDNGVVFADLPKNRSSATTYWSGGHIFGRTCNDNGITRKLTKPYHPWTNGQAERMNRTIKDATLKIFHYPDIESLKAHVLAFVKTYKFAKHLKALRWKTPFEAIAHTWTTDPSIFKINLRHFIPGPNN